MHRRGSCGGRSRGKEGAEGAVTVYAPIPPNYAKLTTAALNETSPREQSREGKDVVGKVCATISQLAVMWFMSPHGSPSGVWTGHRKPQDSGSSLRTEVVLILAKAAPLCTQRKCER